MAVVIINAIHVPEDQGSGIESRFAARKPVASGADLMQFEVVEP